MTGIKTSLNALSTNASQLPNIEIDTSCSVIGKNTINALIRRYAKTSGAKADGKLDAGSITVKAMQKSLNQNKF